MACNGENKKYLGKTVRFHTWGERDRFFSRVVIEGKGLMI